MVLWCKYSCLLTILFIGGILSAPNLRNLRCEILSDLYSSSSYDDLSKVSTRCANENLKFPLQNYCEELFSIQENICGLKFLKNANRDTHPEIFQLPQGLQLKPGEVCGAFKTLNGSLYNVYLNKPEFIGKRLSEMMTCSLFCNEERETECEVLLRTYWIWKVLQEAPVPPDPQAPAPPNPQAKQLQKPPEIDNEKKDPQNQRISPNGTVNSISKPKVTNPGFERKNFSETTHGTEPSKSEQNLSIHSGNNANPSKDNNKHNGKSSQDKNNGPTTLGDEQNGKLSQDKNIDHTASTKKLNEVNGKDDSKLNKNTDDKDNKSKEKPKIDKSTIKETTEGKESTSSLVIEAGNDGNNQENKPGDYESHQGNKDAEISLDPEKISKDMTASTVEDTESGSPVNEFDDDYEGQVNEFQGGGSPNEPESPAADEKTSQNGENGVSDENKSDTKVLPDDTKDKTEQIPAQNSEFLEEEDGHFFAYFLAIVVVCIAGYLVFHNKQKIIALIIEGRHERRRRPNNGTYKRLDSKDSGKATSHVIF